MKTGPKPRDIAERFWEKVDMAGDCWIWTAGRTRGGYGLFVVTQRPLQKPWRAHRLAWTFVSGEIPDGLHVLHRCDNRLCVRPEHLFLGTNDENVADMVAKRRHAYGERNAQAKITKAQAEEVRRLRAVGWTYERLAMRFGLTVSPVRDICKGRAWVAVQL